jgi:signal transduction histidine kinase/ActR/RegA family two-component response regulator
MYDADLDAQALSVATIGAHSLTHAEQLGITEKYRVPIDQNGLARCVGGQLVYEPDVSLVAFPFPQRFAHAGLRSLVMAPLLVEKRIFGVLVVARLAPAAFSSAECEFLRHLSEHVALAANQAQLHGALRQAYDDLRQSQHSAMQQERLRALGQMASGIAHDINNAISPITLYTESLLEREPGLSDRARGYLVTIQRAIDDVAETVARMREFYRAREPELTLGRVALNRMTEHVVDLTRARWSDVPMQKGIVIRLQTELAADLPDIMGSEVEIRDALTNLVFNAVDAMPEGGTLTLRTARTDYSEAEPGPHVYAEVSDTGVGMDDETRRRCLEPFYTTKGERGTGLGLAMVYGMIQRHSAELEIDSVVGKGTTVRLLFAVANAPLLDVKRLPDERQPKRRLHLLLVDDDPLLVKSLREVLEADGHSITAADGGEKGIDLFLAAHSSATPFSLVITDLGMPYVDGRKVAAAVKSAAADTPVILLTGWGRRLLAENDIPPHVDRVLSKPPKLAELRAALAALSDPARRPVRQEVT